MLGLYDEALIQYDELDALFSQFVLNSNVTESPQWLETFKQPVTSWRAVRLTALVPQHLRDLIVKKKASLLDFRSYLFQRQSAMLLLTFKPWEVCINFILLFLGFHTSTEYVILYYFVAHMLQLSLYDHFYQEQPKVPIYTKNKM